MCKRLLVTTGLIILVILASCLSACGSQSVISTMTTPTTTTSQVQQPVLPTVAQVVTRVEPSVVAINVESVTYNIFNQPVKEEGAGSGWIIDSGGYIVTCSHVVEGADNITVTLEDGRTFSAENVQSDSATDLAIIKINASNLPAVGVGDSSQSEVGDWVVAIGNALGYGISATTGIVSAQGVSLTLSAGQTMNDLVQTDAAINPGNSGGPLVNMNGEVIGINSIKIAEVGVEGMGYAYSINGAMSVIEQLIKAAG
jgi:serine protease Do